MIPFSNNLRLGDPVFDTVTQRPGVVSATPRESKRNVRVRLQGDKTPKRLDVMKLRLVVDGKPESVPPVSGEPPAPPPDQKERTPVQVLRDQKDKNQAIMDKMTEEFKALRHLNDRLDRAIEALES